MLYFVSFELELVQVEVGRLVQAARKKDKAEMRAAETAVCKDVDTIGMDGKTGRLSGLSAAGGLFAVEDAGNRLDLHKVVAGCEWTAVGRIGNRSLAAGLNRADKTIAYILADCSSMTAIDSLTVSESVNHGVRHIRLFELQGLTVAVCTRMTTHVDVLRVHAGRLQASGKAVAVDVSSDKSSKWLDSVGRLDSRPHALLIGGHCWLKRLDLSVV